MNNYTEHIYVAVSPATDGVPTVEETNTIFSFSTNVTDPKTVFAQVGANVANFMLLIAGIIVVGMAIYSGWQLISAQGDEGKVEAGKKRLINSLLAAAVITLTFTIIEFIKKLIIVP